MLVKVIKLIMMAHGRIDHFKLHQEVRHYGDKNIKITIF
jgi:hypothetical protein